MTNTLCIILRIDHGYHGNTGGYPGSESYLSRSYIELDYANPRNQFTVC